MTVLVSSLIGHTYAMKDTSSRRSRTIPSHKEPLQIPSDGDQTMPLSRSRTKQGYHPYGRDNMEYHSYDDGKMGDHSYDMDKKGYHSYDDDRKILISEYENKYNNFHRQL
jgi:hypothetical protein